MAGRGGTPVLSVDHGMLSADRKGTALGRYRAVSLFSGCGGFCEGVRLAGFDVVAAVEQDRSACQTYRHNFPDVPLFEGDIRHFLNADSRIWAAARPEFESLYTTPVDLVFGGPPCQGYSQIGTRVRNDPRNTLYLQFTRVLRVLRPKVFLMENVPNMLSFDGGRFKRNVLTALKKAGYANCGVTVVSASDYGVPQARRRAIFFGIRKDYALESGAVDFLNSALAAEKQSQTVVSDVLKELPEQVSVDDSPLPYPTTEEHNDILDELRLDADGRWYTAEYKTARADDPRLYNHHTKGIQERRRKLIEHLAPGDNANALPEGVWTGVRAEKWRRLHPDRPAYTILAQMHRDMSEWVHPEYQRWITVREAARLQSFHDGFIFKTSEWQMLKQIGNAVPPLLARALAAGAVAALNEISGSADVIPLKSADSRRQEIPDEPSIAAIC